MRGKCGVESGAYLTRKPLTNPPDNGRTTLEPFGIGRRTIVPTLCRQYSWGETLSKGGKRLSSQVVLEAIKSPALSPRVPIGSEARGEIEQALLSHAAVRLQLAGRKRPVGVLISPAMWRSLQRLLKEILEELDDDDLRKILEQRTKMPWKPASEAVPEALTLLHERMRE